MILNYTNCTVRSKGDLLQKLLLVVLHFLHKLAIQRGGGTDHTVMNPTASQLSITKLCTTVFLEFKKLITLI